MPTTAEGLVEPIQVGGNFRVACRRIILRGKQRLLRIENINEVSETVFVQRLSESEDSDFPWGVETSCKELAGRLIPFFDFSRRTGVNWSCPIGASSYLLSFDSPHRPDRYRPALLFCLVAGSL